MEKLGTARVSSISKKRVKIDKNNKLIRKKTYMMPYIKNN
jgi:hypothetical protein